MRFRAPSRKQSAVSSVVRAARRMCSRWATSHGLVAWGLACRLVLAAGASASAVGQGRPNVLLVIADDLNTSLGCYGDPAARTPRLDAFARRATLFEHAYAQQALCNPSRASLFTGLHPDQLRIWDLPTHFRDVRPDWETLPQYFKQQGYKTVGIGKIFHNGHHQSVHGDPKSWSVPQRKHWSAHWKDWYVAGAPAGTKPTAQGTATQSEDVPDDTYFDGQIAQLAIEELRTPREQPLFLAVGFWKPHLPFNAPQRYWDAIDAAAIPAPLPADPPQDGPAIALHNSRELFGYADMSRATGVTSAQQRQLRHGYYAAINFVDAKFGKLIDELENQGIGENTIVVVTSDHGFQLGEHRLWGKTSNFERDAHVPLLIAVPGGRGGRSAELVELVDLYPTLAAVAGLPARAGLAGRDLSPLVSREGDSARGDIAQVEPILGALTQHPRPAYYKTEPESMGYSLRTPTHRYTEWRDFPSGRVEARELYDEVGDPDETKNLASAAASAPLVARLAQDLRRTLERQYSDLKAANR